MRRRWRRNHLSNAPELNITAFMNLMVILVPFLLITAVFSRITILELNIPKPSDNNPTELNKPQMDLEVIVRSNSIEIGDKQRGLLKIVTATNDKSDLAEVSDLLQKIKVRIPDKSDITLLLEKDIDYERLVAVMDTLRVAQIEKDGNRIRSELFPVISIGDAPVIRRQQYSRNPG